MGRERQDAQEIKEQRNRPAGFGVLTGDGPRFSSHMIACPEKRRKIYFPAPHSYALKTPHDPHEARRIGFTDRRAFFCSV